MNKLKKYTVNSTFDIRFVDSDTIVIKTLKSRFKMEGNNISIAIKDILSYFKEPTVLDDIICLLQKKYSLDSLQEMLEFLVSKNIVIDDYIAKNLQNHDRNFIDKNLHYTLGGKSLSKIVDEITPMHVGIIGTDQLVNCLLNDLVNTELFFNFNIGITDRVTKFSESIKNGTVKITNYPNLVDTKYMDLFIEKSDFIIVSSSYSDHYLFEQVNELCIKRNKKWIRIMIDGNYSEVGPVFIPSKTCCYSCLRVREISNMDEKKYVFDSLYEKSEMHKDLMEKPVGLYSIYHINSLSSAIACSEIMKFLTGLNCRLLSNVVCVDCDNLTMKVDTIFRNYLCPDCKERL